MRRADSASNRTDRWAAALIVVLILIVLVAQARLLYDFPQPDSARWWGDETGQMMELRTELQEGYARIPAGLGSSVAVTNGLVRGNSWLASAIYGAPAIIFSNAANLVTIGRSVTFILSLALLLAMFAMLRTFSVPSLLSLFAVLLLVTTRSFFFASHAARLDIAASLSLLAFAWYLSCRYDRFRQGQWIPTTGWYFYSGVMVILFATLSIHLLTLLGVLSIYMLWRFRGFRTPSWIFAAIGGSIAMLVVLLSIYAFSGAPVSLFGPSSAFNQFQSVAGGLPILRPFSRSVQAANMIERIHGLWSEAPAFLILVLLAIVFHIAVRAPLPKSARAAWISGAAIVTALSWLLFQSPALYYYIHVLPLFIATIAIGISRRWKETTTVSLVTAGIAILLCYVGVTDTMRAQVIAQSIDRDNHAALLDAVDSIRSDSKSSTALLVLAQNPAIAFLEHEKSVRLMTTHLVSFPVSNAPIASMLQTLDVQYILLYASHDAAVYSQDYHALRPIADSLGTVILRKTGMLFDVHRDYFYGNTLNTNDTLILYKLSAGAR